MAVNLLFSVALLLSFWSTAGCEFLVEGVLQMECRDRYFMIAINLAAAGEDPRFEAIDGSGAYPLTEEYAAKCGYSITVLPFLGLVELRASYFSCHTEKGNGFTFKFNLITTYDGEDAYYALNKTCSLSSTFSPREVACETNFMEVSVRGNLPCPSGLSDDWSSLSSVSSAASFEWQVAFQKPDEQGVPLNLSDARKLGYVFDFAEGRIVFRTPYGQPDSYRTEVTGVPVEMVHVLVFSRQSWVVLMVDLVVACSIYEGQFDGGYMIWSTPEALYPSLGGVKLRLGLDGNLVEEASAEQSGFVVEKQNSTLEIAIPYNAEGGYRKSYISGGLYDFYTYNLHLEQRSVNEQQEETVVRSHRTLITPLLPSPLATKDQTAVGEGVFTVQLAQVPSDIALASVWLNGKQFRVPLSSAETVGLEEVVYPNKTHSYTLKVPLDHSVVLQEFSKEKAAMLHQLLVNFTLLAVPGGDLYYHTVSVTALTEASPPSFHAVCTASGINFKLDYRPFDHLWYISVGLTRLTPELAANRGYIMTNDSSSLQLGVPLFTQGYEYKNVTLTSLLGTFKIFVRSQDTSKVQASSTKTCKFDTKELIMCSTDGRMTVVTDLSAVLPSGVTPQRVHLKSELCLPKERNGTMVLFSFPFQSCGSAVKLMKGNVIYQNKIYFSTSANVTEGMIIQCTYPLSSLHRLFEAYTFQSDKEGFGRIIPFVEPTPEPPTKTTTAALRTPPTVAPQRTRNPMLYLPAFYPTARYVKVYKVQSGLGPDGKGSKGNQQVKEFLFKV